MLNSEVELSIRRYPARFRNSRSFSRLQTVRYPNLRFIEVAACWWLVNYGQYKSTAVNCKTISSSPATLPPHTAGIV